MYQIELRKNLASYINGILIPSDELLNDLANLSIARSRWNLVLVRSKHKVAGWSQYWPLAPAIETSDFSVFAQVRCLGVDET